MKLVTLLETLNSTHEETLKLRVLDHVLFKEGNYSLSIQASEYHYCIPRATMPLKYYTHFEVMTNIPSEDIPDKWIDFQDSGIYPFMPREDIEELLVILDKKYKIIY